MQLHIPNRKISIIRTEGEGEVLRKLNFFREAFGDLATSPYRDRLFVVLDKRISVRIERIESQGVSRDNIVQLSQNGIEYFYPHELVAMTFRCGTEEAGKWQFEIDPMEYNGIRITKRNLAQCVTNALTKTNQLHSEIESLVSRVRRACN